ncbi:hypothetical protein GGR55DRAFT_70592 [Xylaria sp. FL0064]|nr:hypothetical protein GGR55DRAFT_70592 [Xylaria sp. FL0064]
MVVIRPQIADIGQQHSDQIQPRVIDFLHPAYPDGANVLLTLYAVDDDGIDFDFAHTACSIIASNAFAEGWLARRSQDDDGHEKYEPVPRELLKDESYYFCVSHSQNGTSTFDPAEAYRIVTRFDDWEFPHQIWAPGPPRPLSHTYEYYMKPILTWARCLTPRSIRYPGALSDPKMIIKARDQTCRITACSEATEVAHLVPSANISWFDRNRMSRYCSNPIPSGGRSGIDDDQNGMLLRRDLHWLFDASRFVLVPKYRNDGAGDGDDDDEPVLVAHVLQPGAAAELLHLYHNRALQSPLLVAMPLLFARFALSIFKSAAPLGSAGEQQECKVRVFDSAASKYRVKNMTRGQMTVYRTQSRSASPKKRSKIADEDQDDIGTWYADRGSGIGIGSSSGSDSEESWYMSNTLIISESEAETESDKELD